MEPELPSEGGSYLRDPKTGKLTPLSDKEREALFAPPAAPETEAPEGKTRK